MRVCVRFWVSGRHIRNLTDYETYRQNTVSPQILCFLQVRICGFRASNKLQLYYDAVMTINYYSRTSRLRAA